MSLRDQTPNDLRVARIVLNKLDESVVSIESHLFAIVAISEQWRDFHTSFTSVQTSLGSHISELEMKQREFELKQISADNRQNELELKQRRLNSAEDSLNERHRALEERENQLNECWEVRELEKKHVAEWCKAMESKEKRFEELERREKEVKERCREVELKEREAEERCKAAELKEKRFEELERREKEVKERCKAAELKEKRFEELERREKQVEERCEATESEERRLREVEERETLVEQHSLMLGLKEKRIQERCKAVELREKESEERSQSIELEENRIIKRCIELERREKHVNEGCKALEMREKRLDERSVELDLKEKRLNEHNVELELKEKRLHEHNVGLELKEKQLDERNVGLELKEKRLDEHSVELSSKEKRLDEHFVGLDLIEKRLDERLEELDLKESEIDDRSQVLDLREKLMNEHSKAMELREKETDDRCQEIELEEKRISKRIVELETREKEVSEDCKALEMREKQLAEQSEGLDLKKKQIDGQLQELELKESLINEHQRAMELREKENDEHCQAIELEKSQISEWRIELEKREKEVGERCKDHELRENKLNKRFEELELKEKRVDERWEQLELKEKLMNEHSQQTELQENQLNVHSQQMELKETQMNYECKVLVSNSKELDLTENSINEGYEASGVKVKEIDEHYRGLELKEREIDERSQALALQEKQLDERIRSLKLIEKQVNEACQTQEVKEKQIHEHLRVMELKTDEVDLNCKEQGLKEKQMSNTDSVVVKTTPYRDLQIDNWINTSVKACGSMDGKTLQMFLNDRVNEHELLREEVGKGLMLSNDPAKLVLDALCGFFPPHLRRGKVVYETTTVRSSCVLLLELLMNMELGITRSMKKLAHKVACAWREKMREGERHDVVLGFLLLVATYGLGQRFGKHELKRFCNRIRGHRLAPELRLKLDLVEGSDDISQVAVPVASSTKNLCSNMQSLCSSMDVDGLRSYLVEHVMEHDLFHRKILDALQVAPDPAELVFYVVRSLNQPGWSTVDKTSCIVLLEQLMKLQKQQPTPGPRGSVDQSVKQPAQITKDMRQEAKCYASVWKHRFTRGSTEQLEVYCFLQFVAAYKLAKPLHENEIFNLFKRFYEGDVIYRSEQNPYLCRGLGFSKRIPGLIKQLIGSNKGLQAVKYIRAFMQEYHFPIAPILIKHVKFIEEKAVKIQVNGKNTVTAKSKALQILLRHLRAVVQIIKDCELESEYSPTDIESRIQHLEMAKAILQVADAEAEGDIGLERSLMNLEKERAETHCSTNLEKEEVEKNISAQLGKEMVEKNISDAAPPSDTEPELHGGLKRIASPYTSSAIPTQQEKRPRVDTAQLPVATNIPVLTTMHSFPGNPSLLGFPPQPQPGYFRNLLGPIRPYPAWPHGSLTYANVPTPHFPSVNQPTSHFPSANMGTPHFPSAVRPNSHFPSGNVGTPHSGVLDANHSVAQLGTHQFEAPRMHPSSGSTPAHGIAS